MKYDANQAAAVATRSNVVVSAGAGAGKTSVLVGRYVRLVVEDHIPVDRILTLTFTRKAATEMHERIYHALGQRADDPFVTEQLERFDSAVISTLDSFCGSVARSGCAGFGVAPTFTVDEAQLESFSNDLALRFLLNADETHAPTVRSLVRLNRFDPLWREGFARLAADHFLVSRELDLPGMAAAQREYLLAGLASYADELNATTSAIMALDPGSGSCVVNGQQIISQVDLEALTSGETADSLRAANKHESLPSAAGAQLDRLISSLDLLSGIKKSCGASKKPEIAEFKSHVDNLKTFTTRLTDLLVTLGSWHEMMGATALATAFQSVVTAEKRRSGILSYHDVTALAISVLEHDLELRSYYKNRFKSIMIDEFQDNNDEQKRLLYLLAERADSQNPGIPGPDDLDPGKLFFVGDEKQSIYRFRGADVSVFKRLSDELGGEGASITLDSNYRSEPGLIRFFNAFFSRIFSDPDPDYEARFSPLGSRPPTPGVQPSVQLWRLAGRDRDPDLMTEDEAEAYHIATYIRSSVEEGALLVADNEADPVSVRPAGYSDFVILMRSTGNQMRIERMLRMAGIPYVAQTARSLFLEAPMNDIYNALQLVLYPSDRVALAAYLRSPLVGMTDDGVVRVLAAELPDFSAVPGLSVRDQERYELAATRNAELTQLADTTRLTDLIHHIWYRWGYRYHLLRREQYATYLEHYDYIYELARLYEERGLAAMLSSVRSSIGSNERFDELNIVRDDQDGVHIMTIHKAKGLEFPVVIVANTGNRGRSNSVSSSPFYRSDKHGLVFNVSTGRSETPKEQAVNFVYRQEQDEARLQEVAELRRVLYVAATRAETHLVFSGFQRGNDKSLMTMLLPAYLAAAEEIADAPDISIAVRDLEPVPTASRTGNRRMQKRDIALLASAYQAADASRSVTRRLAARREFTPSELNAIHLETNRSPPAAHPSAAGGAAIAEVPGAAGEPLSAQVSNDSGPQADVAGAAGEPLIAEVSNDAGEPASAEVTQDAGEPASAEVPGAAGEPAIAEVSNDAGPAGRRDAGLFIDTAAGAGFADTFGTFAHYCIEQLGSRRTDAGALQSPARLPASVRPSLEGSQLRRFLSEGVGLAQGFLASGFWKASQSAAAEFEMPFLLELPVGAGSSDATSRVRGKMDLVLESEDSVVVVDFKTDRELIPAHYAVQMDLYRRAASSIFGKPARSILFHLRTGADVPVDTPIDDEELESLISALRQS